MAYASNYWAGRRVTIMNREVDDYDAVIVRDEKGKYQEWWANKDLADMTDFNPVLNCYRFRRVAGGETGWVKCQHVASEAQTAAPPRTGMPWTPRVQPYRLDYWNAEGYESRYQADQRVEQRHQQLRQEGKQHELLRQIEPRLC